MVENTTAIFVIIPIVGLFLILICICVAVRCCRCCRMQDEPLITDDTEGPIPQPPLRADADYAACTEEEVDCRNASPSADRRQSETVMPLPADADNAACTEEKLKCRNAPPSADRRQRETVRPRREFRAQLAERSECRNASRSAYRQQIENPCYLEPPPPYTPRRTRQNLEPEPVAEPCTREERTHNVMTMNAMLKEYYGSW